jgi:hypothetical protein
MPYDIIIPNNYKDAVASAIAGKKLTGLNERDCLAVLDSIAEFARGSAELFGLLASLNMQYICNNSNFNVPEISNKSIFKSAKIFQDADISVGNVYLIHNKLVLVRAVDKNRFVGVLVTKNIDIIIDCKKAMLIGSFKDPIAIPSFELEITDCYVLYTPALGVFWGFNCNDNGDYLKLDTIKDEKTLTEGVMHFVNGIEHNFNLLITKNPDDKNRLIDKMKTVIENEQSDSDISAKWFHFDEIELFHIPFSQVVKK